MNDRIVDTIKSRIDLADIVSKYTPLKRRGTRASALCPFHTEKTPSFHVNLARGRWHCFGACATGGDVFNFLMKAEGIDFSEALRRLASQAGVEYKRTSKARTEKEKSEYARLLRINKIAHDWFVTMLDSSATKEAREYLTKRGFDKESMGAGGIGYAPGGALTLRDKLKAEGIDEADALAAGVLVKTDGGATQDFFKERVTFRINDRKGQIIGFGARTLGDAQPKYINTPETKLFKKSSILYGLDNALSTAQEARRLVLVEGYMDVLAAHGQGFKNVVGTMGVALTEEQLTVVLPAIKGGELVLCLDADAAGQAATVRSLKELWGFLNRNDIDVKVIEMVSGKDPDEIIRNSPQEWRNLNENPKPAGTFLMESAASQLDLSTPEGKQKLLAEMSPLLIEIRNDFARDEYVQNLAELLGITPSQLDSRIRSTYKPSSPAPRNKGNNSQYRGNTFVDNIGPVSVPKSMEDVLLAILINYPDAGPISDGIKSEYWQDSLNRHIFELWRNKELEKAVTPPAVEKLDNLNRLLEEQAQAQNAQVYNSDEELFKAVNEMVSRLEERHLKQLLLEFATDDEVCKESNRRLAEIYEQRQALVERKQDP